MTQALIHSVAKRALEAVGESVTYTAAGGQPKPIKAMVQTQDLMASRSRSSKTLAYACLIEVAKADVPVVTINADTVSVPAAWVGLSGEPVTCRVTQNLGNLAEAGTWVLGVTR